MLTRLLQATIALPVLALLDFALRWCGMYLGKRLARTIPQLRQRELARMTLEGVLLHSVLSFFILDIPAAALYVFFG